MLWIEHLLDSRDTDLVIGAMHDLLIYQGTPA